MSTRFTCKFCGESDGYHRVGCEVWVAPGNSEEPLAPKDALFECHITLEKPKQPAFIEVLEKLAKKYGWKTSVIDGDPVLGKEAFFYLTGYHADLDQMKIRMHEMADRMPPGVNVLRKKIEQIVYDSRKEWQKG